MEIIPQKNFLYEEGVLPYKSGEWPGIKPSRWRGSKLILKPIKMTKEISTFDRSIGGQRHFQVRYSDDFKYKPQKKLLPRIEYPDKFKPEKKYIEPHYSEPLEHERKLLSKNITVKPEPVTGKLHVLPATCSNEEIFLENQMTRKGRVLCLKQMRNDMPEYAPGDKVYKSVDYSPNFFLLEGLTVGSTIGLHHNKTSTRKSDNFFSTLDLNVKTLNPEKMWTSKVIKERETFDKDYVLQLQNWEQNTFPTVQPVKK